MRQQASGGGGPFLPLGRVLLVTPLLIHPPSSHLSLLPLSDYEYTNKMMSFAYDRFLPEGMKWRDLFDMVCGGGASSSILFCENGTSDGPGKA